jgi:hypothetical protein
VQADFGKRRPAQHQAIPEAAAAFAAEGAHHQRVAGQAEQRGIDQAEAEIGGDAGAEAEDRGRHGLGHPRRADHHGDGNQADHDACQRHLSGRQQRGPEVHALGRAEQLGHLAGNDDQANAGQVTADHRVGHVLDQQAQPQRAKHHLHQARQQPEQGQQQHGLVHRRATRHGVDGESGDHGGGGCARGRDQPAGAAKAGGHDAHRHGAENAGQRAERDMRAAEHGVDGYAIGDRGWQSHHHRGHAAPEIARRVFQSWQFHVLVLLLRRMAAV